MRGDDPVPANKVKGDLVGKHLALGKDLPADCREWKFEVGPAYPFDLEIKESKVTADELRVTVKLKNYGC